MGFAFMFFSFSFFITGISGLQCHQVSNQQNCTNVTGCATPQNCNVSTSYLSCQTVYNNASQGIHIMHAGCWGECYQPQDNKSSCIVHHGSGKYFSCCCTADFCNSNLVIIAENLVRTTRSTLSSSVTGKTSIPSSNLALIFTTIGLLMIAAIAVGIIWRLRKKNQANRRSVQDHIPASPPVQSKPIQFHEEISRGKYSCVMRGTYEHKEVAVKIILPNERDSWETERTMYCDCQLWHENVLRFHSAEKRCELGCDQYWIITEFHEQGSLADYLSSTVLDYDDLLKVLLSIVSGLVYLHEDDMSRVPPKPAIAHRDFKSRNVLVKRDGSCCIGDFGLACLFYDGGGSDESKLQVGTKRYMAPEVLQGAVGFQTESFLSIDIYSLALVMWESLTRCSAIGPVEPYRVAFEHEVGQHPTIDDMRSCVVDQHCRPIIKPEWRENKSLSLICTTTEECWDDDADARLSASCVFERLSYLRNTQKTKESLPLIPDIEGEEQALLTSNV